MNKTWLIIGLIVAIVLGLLIFGNIFADGRQALSAPKKSPTTRKKGVELYATDETADLRDAMMGH